MYEYDLKKIGKRIRSERLKAGYTSQKIFAKKFFLSDRQTVSKWENGKKLPSIDNLLTMCDLFHCQLGYLLCEYDCKTGENTNIHNLIGLSEKSINILKFIKSETALSDSLKALNRIIEHPEFIRESLAEELKRPENEVERIMETISESTISTDLLNILHDLKRTNH